MFVEVFVFGFTDTKSTNIDRSRVVGVIIIGVAIVGVVLVGIIVVIIVVVLGFVGVVVAAVIAITETTAVSGFQARN